MFFLTFILNALLPIGVGLCEAAMSSVRKSRGGGVRAYITRPLNIMVTRPHPSPGDYCV